MFSVRGLYETADSSELSLSNMRNILAVVLFVAALQPKVVSAAEEWETVDAVVWTDQLVVLQPNGMCAVWKLKGGETTPLADGGLALRDVRRLASDGESLWAATSAGLFRRGRGESKWTLLHPLTKNSDPLLALLAVGGFPLLIHPTHVSDPVRGRDYPVPKSTGQVPTNELRLQAGYATGKMVWLGTGHGEWGGTLYGLEPVSGAWRQYTDALHYVTGITSADGENVSGSWAMSHFIAHTLVREHGTSVQAQWEGPELKSQYYQRIAYSSFDRVLYGIENKSLGRIVRGRPEEIVSLSVQVFTRENYAIGAAPGVRAVIPIAAKVVIVVPNSGAPLRVSVAEKKTSVLSR